MCDIEKLIRDSERLRIVKDYVNNTDCVGGSYIEKSVLLVLLGESPIKADDK